MMSKKKRVKYPFLVLKHIENVPWTKIKSGSLFELNTHERYSLFTVSWRLQPANVLKSARHPKADFNQAPN